MSCKRCAVLALAFVVVVLGLTRDAEARRRGLPLIIINTGDEIYKVADLPPALAAVPDLQGWSLGWKCKHFGILWADFRTWDRQLVAFKDDTYSDIPEDMRADLEAQYPFSGCQRNPWNRYGAVLLVGLVGFGAFSKLRRS